MSSTDDLYDALERCAATSGKKEKLAVVKGLGEFKGWLQLALDPTIAFYVAKLPAYPKSGDSTLTTEDAAMLMRLASRELSGNEALEQIKFTMYELTPKSQEVLRRIILKDLRCGVGETIFHDAFPGAIPYFPYMRCVLEKDSNMAEWDWTAGIFVQLKADGMFANVNLDLDREIGIFSRQGTPFPPGAFPSLERALAKSLRRGAQTHGELTVYDPDGNLLERQIGNGILNSIAQGGALPADHAVVFDAWDQIPLAAAVRKGSHPLRYADRFADLQEQVELDKLGLVRLIESQVVYSKAEMLKLCAAYQKRKLEGVIAKHPDAFWRDGDNKDQVKGKLEVPVDLKIVGFRPGEVGKRTEHTFGSVVCRTSDDLLEVGVHGFKREVEADIHERRDQLIGTVMTVMSNGVMPPNDDGISSLFLPRFVELRRDKKEADSLRQVVDQFEAAVAV